MAAAARRPRGPRPVARGGGRRTPGLALLAVLLPDLVSPCSSDAIGKAPLAFAVFSAAAVAEPAAEGQVPRRLDEVLGAARLRGSKEAVGVVFGRNPEADNAEGFVIAPPTTAAEIRERIVGDEKPRGPGRNLIGAVAQAFIKLDLNRDQRLDLAEFVKATLKFKPPLTREQAEYAFASFDADHDHQVTVDEFAGEVNGLGHFTSYRTPPSKPYVTLGQLKQALGVSYQRPEAIFVGLDGNGDGYSDPGEFLSGAAGLGLSPKQLEYAFRGLDLDHDGRIGPLELFRAVQADNDPDAPLPGAGGGLAPARLETVAGAVEPITVTEFVSQMAQPSQQVFLTLDTSSDGFLDRAEFSGPAAARAFSKPLDADQAEYVFKGLDANHDGQVHIAEFFGTLRLGGFYQTPEALQAIGAVIQPAPPLAPAPVLPSPPSATAAPPLAAGPAVAAAPPAAPIAPAQPLQPLAPQGPPAPAQPPQPPPPQAPSQPMPPPAAQAPSTQGQPQGPAAAPQVPILTAPQLRSRLASPEAAFAVLDADKDGFVSAQEYGALRSTFTPPLSPEEAASTFVALDADHDGRVGPPELLTAMQVGHYFESAEALQAAVAALAVPALPQQAASVSPIPVVSRLGRPHEAGEWTAPITLADFVTHLRSSYTSPQEAFTAMDADKGGSLDFMEFANGVRAFHQPLDDTQAMYAFEGFDADSDHKITDMEFYGHLKLGHFFQTPEALQQANGGAIPAKAYDCDTGLSRAQVEWSEDRQEWCCENQHKGCRDSTAAPTAAAVAGAPNSATPAPASVAGGTTQAIMTFEQFVQRVGTHIVSPADAFNKLDTSQDGYVDGQELLTGEAFNPRLSEGEAQEVLSGFDVDGNSKIDGPEFLAVIQARHFAHEPAHPPRNVWKATGELMTLPIFVKHLRTSYASPADAFHGMDADQDEYVTQGEFVTGATGFGSPVTQEEAEYAFAGLDADGDQLLCKSEFLGVVRVGRFYQTAQTLTAAGIRIEKPPHAPAVLPPPPRTNASNVTEAPTTGSPNPTPVPDQTTAPPSWEVQDVPIRLPAFAQRMGPTLPSAIQVLNGTAGGCVDIARFRQAAEHFTPPLTRQEVDYAFCGMDENHDKRVCSFEFFGILKIGHFFPSRADMEHLKEVGALRERPGEDPHNPAKRIRQAASETTSTTAVPTAAALVMGRQVLNAELELYRGVQAMVSGHAEVTLHILPAASTLGKHQEQEIGQIFKKVMHKELQLDIDISDIEGVHVDVAESGKISNGRDKTVMILWTAGMVDDGGSLQYEMRKKAADIENQMQDFIADKHYEWLDRVTFWAEVTLSYYGIHAADLPEGNKIAQDIGHKPGAASENDMPAYVPA